MTVQPMTKEDAQGSGEHVVNDFSMTVATMNGSGSQTSNLTLLRAFFKMGIPVSGKNLVPIQHPGFANLVHHPLEQRWLSGPP